MEQKKSKVVATSLKKEGTGQYGPYFIHLIVFENGDSGDYMAKKNPQDYFKVGLEAEYTKETKQNGQYQNTSIKPIQTQGSNGFKGGSPLSQNKRTALECAVSLAVAGKIQIDQIGAKAVSFSAWLNEETKQTIPPIPTQKPQPRAPVQEPDYVQDDNSDLPF